MLGDIKMKISLMMQKLAIIASCALALSACNKSTVVDDSVMPTAKIGFAMSGDKGEFFSEAARSFQKIAGEHPSISLTMQQAEQNADAQMGQIKSIADSGVQAMIFHLVDPSRGQEIVNTYCTKFPLIFFNRSPGDRALASCKNAYFVDGDASQSGILLGLKILQQWRQNPAFDKNKDGVIQYALVETTPDWIAGKLRGNWTVSTMSSYPELKHPTQEVFRGYGGFENKIGYELIKSWMADSTNFNRIELIITTNELNGIGVVQALKEQQIKIPLYTIDGSDNGFAAIKSGDIMGGVGHDFDTEALISLRLAANLANNKPALEGIRYEMFDKEILLPYIDMNPSGQAN